MWVTESINSGPRAPAPDTSKVIVPCNKLLPWHVPQMEKECPSTLLSILLPTLSTGWKQSGGEPAPLSHTVMWQYSFSWKDSDTDPRTSGQTLTLASVSLSLPGAEMFPGPFPTWILIRQMPMDYWPTNLFDIPDMWTQLEHNKSVNEDLLR